MKKLELYLVEFNKIGQIISKIHLSGCEIGKDKRQLVIIIIQNKYIFLSNNGFWFGWQKDRDIFLYPKSKIWKIVIVKFLFFFGQLNLLSLSELSQQNLIERCDLLKTEVVEIFEFEKNNQEY